MPSVAADLRTRTREQVRAMRLHERIELSLRLGDADVEVFMRMNQASRAEALRVLRQQRQRGRRASRCARPEPQ